MGTPPLLTTSKTTRERGGGGGGPPAFVDADLVDGQPAVAPLDPPPEDALPPDDSPSPPVESPIVAEAPLHAARKSTRTVARMRARPARHVLARGRVISPDSRSPTRPGCGIDDHHGTLGDASIHPCGPGLSAWRLRTS